MHVTLSLYIRLQCMHTPAIIAPQIQTKMPNTTTPPATPPTMIQGDTAG